MKVAVVAPARTVTLDGTVAAAVLLLVSVTVAPPAGAARVSVTVPVEEVPPVTEVGFTVTDCKAGGTAGFTVSIAVLFTPLKVAVTVTLTLDATLNVVIEKFAVDEPAGTRTVSGTVTAAVLLLARMTCKPPVGAAALKVTVPVEVVPPVTEDGFTLTDERSAPDGLMNRVAV